MDMRRDSRSSEESDSTSKLATSPHQESSMDLFRRFSFKNLYQEDHEHLYGPEHASPLTRDLSADLDYGGVQTMEDEDEQALKKQKLVKWGALGTISIFLVASVIALILSFSGYKKSSGVSDPFGHQLLEEFSFQQGYISLNHGTYGAVPTSVLESATDWTKYVETNPDRWYRYEKQGLQASVRSRLASFVGANDSDIVFTPSVSHSMAALIRAVHPSDGSKATILHFNLLASNTKAVIKDLSRSSACSFSSLQVNVTFPTTSQEILTSFLSVLNSTPGANVFVVVVDHITSLPAIVLPVESIVQECRSRNIPVIVNGAHAVGNLPLNLQSLDADFYLANPQKWLFTPKGSTFLYVNPRVQSLLPLYMLKWNGEQQNVQTETQDFSPYLAIGNAIDFRSKFGEGKIMSYTHTLAQIGGRRLANMWNTNVLGINDPTLIDVAMTTVRLPINPPLPDSSVLTPTQLSDAIFSSHQTWVPIFEWNGDWYCRVSAQIYNQESDIIYYGNAMITTLTQFHLLSGANNH